MNARGLVQNAGMNHLGGKMLSNSLYRVVNLPAGTKPLEGVRTSKITSACSKPSNTS
jgi:hypothetical protein